MSLSAVLAKPDAFEATTDTVGEHEIQFIADLTRVFIQNPRLGRKIGEKILPVMVSKLRGFLVLREENARLAFGKARNLFSPMETTISTLINGLDTDIFDTIPKIIDIIQSILDGLTLEKIKIFVADVWDLAVDDLDVSGNTIHTLIRDMFDTVVMVLRQDYKNGARDAQAIALLDFSYRVDRLRGFVMDEMKLPGIEKQLLINAVEHIWKSNSIDETITTIKTFFDAGEEIVEPLANIAQCIVQQLQAAAGTHSGDSGSSRNESPGWYAARTPDESMLFRETAAGTSGAGGNEVTAWYASWVAGKNVSYCDNTAEAVNIYENPELRGFTYKHVSRETMEALAFHTAWITPALECIPHLVSIEKGDVASNAANIMWNFMEAVINGAGKIDFPRWSQWLGLPVITTLGGFESHEGRWSWGNDPYVIINMLGDYGEVYTYRRYSWTLRETILSLVTLLNNDPEQAAQWRSSATDLSEEEKETAWHNRNNNCFAGTCYFFGELMSMMLPGILSHTDKKNYGFVGGGPAKQFWYTFLGGGAITWVSEYLFGGIASRLLAGEWFSHNVRFGMLPFRERCIKGLFFSDLWGASEVTTSIFPGLLGLFGRPIDNYLMLYFFTNGNTNDGTYCLDDTGVERTYMGFPALEHSTYKLPWTRGRDMQCVQNPMGIWSHFPEGKQTYAYDFSHKEGEPVLCSRSGIVRRSRDTIADHDTSDWNYIEIVHVMEIAPGEAVPDNLIQYPQVYSPYTGRRNYADPAPSSGTLQKYPFTDTDIPLDVVFPALPDGSTPIPRESAARPSGTSFAFIDKHQDRAMAGKTFDDSPNLVFAPDITAANHGTATSYPVGTTFLPPADTVYNTTGGVYIAAKGYEALTATCCSYGHGMQGFIQRVFSSRLSRPNKTSPWTDADISWEFITQGEQVMEAGDTGISAYNHLHTHVTGLFADVYEANNLLTIPFLYEGHGVLKAMDYYTSDNEA
ncbi:hypothetical protein [Desulfobacula sp.]|uniref:hypothetical protein n=1 Tax=Desulfobacula sp. TaxID=2593537 RepID=UPI002622D8A0|nr:hypothetical protein [Desulfobacula sp.]